MRVILGLTFVALVPAITLASGPAAKTHDHDHGAAATGPREARRALPPTGPRLAAPATLALPDCSIVDIASSEFAGYGIATDGSLWSWGDNEGQVLGRADTSFTVTSPMVHRGVADVTAVSSYEDTNFVAALHGDGTVSAWGSNMCGLGDGVSTDSMSPVPVSGLSGVTVIAVGRWHGLAVRDDGTVWSWGCNDDGQLGDGSTNPSAVPVQVMGLANVSSVAAGDRHSLALLPDGSVQAWGFNNRGQLGDNSNNSSPVPVPVAGLAGVAQITAGLQFSLALLTDGTVESWGRNDLGQLGIGNMNDRRRPTAIGGLGNVVQIDAGFDNALAVRGDGTVAAWGDDYYLQIGAVQIYSATSPIDVPGITMAVKVSAGRKTSMVLQSDGTLASWGIGPTLGNGHRSETNVASKMATGGFTRVDAGDYHSLAIDAGGDVWGWGWNWSGMATGAAVHEGVGVPTRVTGVSGALDVAAGFEHSLAVDGTGRVWAWGSNHSGFLGDGSFTDRVDPVLAVGITGAVDVAAGWSSSYALLGDGTVRAWGTNDSGELGNGTYDLSETPVTVVGLDRVVAIDCYEYHVVALRDDGTVWVWGAGWDGQLGDGNYTESPIPIQVPGITDAIAVAASGHATLAALASGEVWAWGDNSDFLLGDPSPSSSGDPVLVPGIGSVAKLAAGHGSVHALLVDGTVRSWGGNYWGQLGLGRLEDRVALPSSTVGLDNIIGLSGGEQFLVALAGDSSVWTVGYNLEGQLGDGELAATHVPVGTDFDRRPLDQGNTLLAWREAADVRLTFNAASASAWGVYRDSTKLGIGTTPLTSPLEQPAHTDLAVSTDGMEYYYAVRGLSACSYSPGP